MDQKMDEVWERSVQFVILNMVTKIRIPQTVSFFFYFEQLLICLIKQQKTLGAVIAEYEADNGDRRRGNVDEQGVFEECQIEKQSLLALVLMTCERKLKTKCECLIINQKFILVLFFLFAL